MLGTRTVHDTAFERLQVVLAVQGLRFRVWDFGV